MDKVFFQFFNIPNEKNQFHKTTCNHQHKYTMNKTNQESWQWNRHHQHVEKIKWSQIALPHLYLLHMPIKRGKGSFVVVTMFFGWEEEACLKAEDERCWELWGLGDLEEIKKIKLVCVCVYVNGLEKEKCCHLLM